MIKHLLTFDVEEYFVVEAFRHVIEPAAWPAMESRVEQQVRDLLDLLEEAGVYATFFVLGWVAERHRTMVRTIASRGHEVASHGYGHDCVHRLSPTRFAEDIRRARGILSDLSGTDVVGYRAPTFTIMRENLWALDVLLQEGYQYDSSIFPIRHDRYGIPGFPPHPVRLVWPTGAFLDEYPMAILDTWVGRLPVAGGGYFRLLPLSLLRWAWDRLTKEKSPSVFYLHPWELDPEQPKVGVGWVRGFRHYSSLRKTKGRLMEWLSRYHWTSFDAMRKTASEPGLTLLRSDLDVHWKHEFRSRGKVVTANG